MIGGGALPGRPQGPSCWALALILIRQQTLQRIRGTGSHPRLKQAGFRAHAGTVGSFRGLPAPSGSRLLHRAQMSLGQSAAWHLSMGMSRLRKLCGYERACTSATGEWMHVFLNREGGTRVVTCIVEVCRLRYPPSLPCRELSGIGVWVGRDRDRLAAWT